MREDADQGPAAVPPASMPPLARWGGILVAPASTLAGLSAPPAGEPAVGAADGIGLSAAYVLGTQILRLAGGVASLAAMGNVNGGLVLLQSIGRALLPPIVLLFLVESALGKDRAYRRGVFVAPLVLMGVAGRLMAHFGYPLPGPSFAPDLVGVVWAAALAFGLRSKIQPEVTDA